MMINALPHRATIYSMGAKGWGVGVRDEYFMFSS